MNHQMIAWCAIAGVLLCAFILRGIERYCAEYRSRGHRARNIVEIGKERDIFFVPGDFTEEDDFEDL